MSKSGETISVFTYNLLTPPYGTAEEYCENTYFDMNATARWDRIRETLKQQVLNRPKAIVCLQEVCEEWYCFLVEIFDKYDYTFVYRQYGHERTGFMGVGIAYPRAEFELEECCFRQFAKALSERYTMNVLEPLLESTPISVSKVGISREKVPVIEPFEISSIGWIDWIRQMFWMAAKPLVSQDTQSLLKTKTQAAWDSVVGKENCVAYVRLKSRATGKRFAVSTVHMPCDWRNPDRAVLYSLALNDALDWIISGATCPLVLAGDFNMLRESFAYSTLLQKEEQDTLLDRDWCLSAMIEQQMQSMCNNTKFGWHDTRAEGALASTTCTAVCMRKNKQAGVHRFQGVIDYVFVSKEITSAKSIKLYQDVEKYDNVLLPSASLRQGSDHLLIGAEITLPC